MSEHDYAVEILEEELVRQRWILDLRYPKKEIKGKIELHKIKQIAQLKSAIKRLKE